MRTPAETLRLALANYEAECALFDDDGGHRSGGPFMCCTLSDLVAAGELLDHEAYQLRVQIVGWIDHNVSLRVYLDRAGRPSDRQARIDFYRGKLRQLEEETRQ